VQIYFGKSKIKFLIYAVLCTAFCYQTWNNAISSQVELCSQKRVKVYNCRLSVGSEGAVMKKRQAPKRAYLHTARSVRRRAGGFTLVQILVVITLISVLAALMMGVVGRGREEARRAQCDTRLKAIALALDAFRQENGHYPTKLAALVEDKYLQGAEALRCPDEVRADGSYEEYYIPRAPHEPPQMGEVPMLVCPLHEEHNHGMQAYRGRYTKQFSTTPARLAQASGVDIERPDGKGRISATQGMALRGGDKLFVGGMAKIEFADGSTCDLQSGSEITVLQSFVEGAGASPLYSIVRQTLGKARYNVHHGSKFDVVTPTATAGVRGTIFTVDIKANGQEEILLETESPMFVSTTQKVVKVKRGEPVGLLGGILSGGINLIGGLLGGLF
jgi:competence protein ComGC